jgi:hypothetical protein
LKDCYKDTYNRMLDQSSIEDMHEEDVEKVESLKDKMVFLQKMIDARYDRMEYNLNLNIKARKEEAEKRWADRVEGN